MSNLRDYNFEFNRANLKEIITVLKDLTRIDQMIKMKIDKEHVLFYSRAGKDNFIHGFKSFMYPVEEFITADEPIIMDFIVLNGGNFVKNLELYLAKETPIHGRLAYKDKDKIAGMMYITDGKLKFNFVTGDYRQIKDISKQDVENKMNPDLANFSFTMTGDEFSDIKKLSALNKSETISMRVKKGKLEFFDTRWSVHVADLPTVEDEIWTFNNKYLKSITPSDHITIHMFDQFLLFKEDNVALMIGLELSNIR